MRSSGRAEELGAALAWGGGGHAGNMLGRAVGSALGKALGRALGKAVGNPLGRAVGNPLGRAVGKPSGSESPLGSAGVPAADAGTGGCA
jgi:hypothetical protein